MNRHNSKKEIAKAALVRQSALMEKGIGYGIKKFRREDAYEGRV